MRELKQLTCVIALAVSLAYIPEAYSAPFFDNAFVEMDGWDAETQWTPGDINCTHGLREFNEHKQKRVYTVGVHAPTGEQNAWNEFNLTFETYLTEVVGKRWDPPIEFKMVASEWPLLNWIDEEKDVDFMYSDTGLYSCIGTEIGAQPMATTIANMESRGEEYELDIYGGKITTRFCTSMIAVETIILMICCLLISHYFLFRHNLGT